MRWHDQCVFKAAVWWVLIHERKVLCFQFQIVIYCTGMTGAFNYNPFYTLHSVNKTQLYTVLAVQEYVCSVSWFPICCVHTLKPHPTHGEIQLKREFSFSMRLQFSSFLQTITRNSRKLRILYSTGIPLCLEQRKWKLSSNVYQVCHDLKLNWDCCLDVGSFYKDDSYKIELSTSGALRGWNEKPLHT